MRLEEFLELNADLFLDYDGNPQIILQYKKETFVDTVRYCAEPSLSQIKWYVCTIIGWNLLCRLSLLVGRWTYSRPWIDHLISFVCGCGVLFYTVGMDFVIVFLFSIVLYVMLKILEYERLKYAGFAMGSICIVSLFSYELLAENPVAWGKIRGTLMVATMKIISLAFDWKAKRLNRVPGLVPFLGYIYCPGTVVLGPWIGFDEYTINLTRPQKGFRWIFWLLSNLIAAVGFLLLSNCFVALLSSDHSWKWVVAYRDALSYRCSHYFISFLSQGAMAACGIGYHPNSPDISPTFGHMVTDPLDMELPRSLIDLVRRWNMPMHRWLKTYVFRTIRTQSAFLAIAATYLISSLLHGMHFQIYAVLLSLGLFTFIEFKLRAKIARLLNACVLPKPCGGACNHRYKWTSTRSIILNATFALLTVVHLAYLGIMMDGPTSPSSQTGSISIESGLYKWMSLDYLSHWIFTCSYFLYLFM